jgi:hypothetical protein
VGARGLDGDALEQVAEPGDHALAAAAFHQAFVDRGRDVVGNPARDALDLAGDAVQLALGLGAGLDDLPLLALGCLAGAHGLLDRGGVLLLRLGARAGDGDAGVAQRILDGELVVERLDGDLAPPLGLDHALAHVRLGAQLAQHPVAGISLLRRRAHAAPARAGGGGAGGGEAVIGRCLARQEIRPGDRAGADRLVQHRHFGAVRLGRGVFLVVPQPELAGRLGRRIAVPHQGGLARHLVGAHHPVDVFLPRLEKSLVGLHHQALGLGELAGQPAGHVAGRRGGGEADRLVPAEALAHVHRDIGLGALHPLAQPRRLFRRHRRAALGQRQRRFRRDHAVQRADGTGQHVDRRRRRLQRASIADGDQELLDILLQRIIGPGQPASLGAAGAANLLLHRLQDHGLRLGGAAGGDQRFDHLALRAGERHADAGEGGEPFGRVLQRLAELDAGAFDGAEADGGQILRGAQGAAERLAGHAAEGQELLRRRLDAGRAGQGGAGDLLRHLADLLGRDAGRAAGGAHDGLGAQAQPLELLRRAHAAGQGSDQRADAGTRDGAGGTKRRQRRAQRAEAAVHPLHHADGGVAGHAEAAHALGGSGGGLAGAEIALPREVEQLGAAGLRDQAALGGLADAVLRLLEAALGLVGAVQLALEAFDGAGVADGGAGGLFLGGRHAIAAGRHVGVRRLDAPRPGLVRRGVEAGADHALPDRGDAHGRVLGRGLREAGAGPACGVRGIARACSSSQARSIAMMVRISKGLGSVPVSAAQAARSAQAMGLGPMPLLPRPAWRSSQAAKMCWPQAGISGPSRPAGRRPVWRSTLSRWSRFVAPSGWRADRAKSARTASISSARSSAPGSFPGRPRSRSLGGG